MLKVVLPSGYKQEKEYICKILLGDFLGLEYAIEYKSNSDFIELQYGIKSLYVREAFFKTLEKDWLTVKSLPQKITSYIDCKKHFEKYRGQGMLPVIFGSNTVKYTNNATYIDVDIFGSCFFMLTRYEEYVIKKRDNLDRFEYKESFAYKNSFLDRPIVNEYLELLWCGIRMIAPDLERRKRKYAVIPTHDIDKPFGILYDSNLQIIRHFIGDIVYKRGLTTVVDRIKHLKYKYLHKDVCINEGNGVIDFIIEASRKYGLKDVFYFMNSKQTLYDGNYYVDYPDLIKMIEKIISHGHSVGLHPSYNSYLNMETICSENKALVQVVDKLSSKGVFGGRQHYLRWSNPETWRAYEYVGLKSDSTLTFAGCAGFRCGVCYPYKVYDLVERRTMDVVERPLIVMDGTLFEYMKLSNEEALEICIGLAEQCRKYDGEFIFLWHNTMLYDKGKKDFYIKLLESVTNGK